MPVFVRESDDVEAAIPWSIPTSGRKKSFPSESRFIKIKECSSEGSLNAVAIEALFSEDCSAAVQVGLKREKLKRYFPQSCTTQQMGEVIVSLLELWSVQQKHIAAWAEYLSWH